MQRGHSAEPHLGIHLRARDHPLREPLDDFLRTVSWLISLVRVHERESSKQLPNGCQYVRTPHEKAQHICAA